MSRVLLRSSILALLALVPALAAEAQEEPAGTEIQHGESTILRLEKEQALSVFRIRVRPGAHSLEVVLSSWADLDLAVSERLLTLDEAREAPHRGYTMRTIERVLVRPEEGDQFLEEKEWFLHVFRTWNEEEDVGAEITAWVHTTEPTLLAEGINRIRLPAGERPVRRLLHLPRFVQTCSLRTEAPLSAVRMIAAGSGREIGGSPRGGATELRIGRDPQRGGETWSLELRATGGKDQTAVVEMSWAIRPDLLAYALGGEERRIHGEEGSLEHTFEDGTRADFFFDVDARTHMVELASESWDGDVEIYVSRFKPPVLPDEHLGFAALGDEPKKLLRMGGRAPLPMGRYWVRIDCDKKAEPGFRLRWKRYTASRIPDPAGPPPLLLENGRSRKVTLAKGSDRVTFLLPEEVKGGSHIQVIGARTDTDLFLRRDDTNEILLASADDLMDEHLTIPTDLVLASGVGLLLDVFRWSTDRAEDGGRVHLDAARRPLPGVDFAPPYEVWKQTPRDRALAATVMIDTDEGGGSGIVVAPDGLILTAGHVLDDIDPDEIIVSFPRTRHGQTQQCYLAAIEVRSDEETDLALLRLRKDTFGRPVLSKRFPFVPLGGASNLTLGDPLRLLGYPSATERNNGGHLTVLAGIVSSMQLEGGRLLWLASDLPASAGNSGGGLFDTEWRLIGVHLSTDTLAFSRPLERLPKEWRVRIKTAGGEVGSKQ